MSDIWQGKTKMDVDKTQFAANWDRIFGSTEQLEHTKSSTTNATNSEK